MARKIQVPSIFSPKPSQSFVMSVCSGTSANNCRGHVNPHSARQETASASIFLEEWSLFCLFFEKVILQANCYLFSLVLYICSAGKSIFGEKHVRAMQSF